MYVQRLGNVQSDCFKGHAIKARIFEDEIFVFFCRRKNALLRVPLRLCDIFLSLFIFRPGESHAGKL